MTAYDDMKTTVEAIKAGAFEYLVKPLDFVQLDLTVGKAFQVKALEEKVSFLVEERQKEYTIDNIIGHSSSMREVFKLIGSVAGTRTNVLIQGDSGTGKELVAKAIHYNSPYREEPFIVINCSAITDTLLESELFGHVKGAFTDAVFETKGKFEIAGKGTLFLDEIGDVSPSLQSKLLRVIESRDFMKVGGEKVLKTEARILAATNHNLEPSHRAGAVPRGPLLPAEGRRDRSCLLSVSGRRTSPTWSSTSWRRSTENSEKTSARSRLRS